jgi:hypothetical protein
LNGKPTGSRGGVVIRWRAALTRASLERLRELTGNNVAGIYT